MNLKLKLMAAAVALVAASGAHADITTSSAGNGELFFTVYDLGDDLSSNVDDRAYVRDLGGTVNANGNWGLLNDWATAPSSGTPVLNTAKSTVNISPIPYLSVAADANLQSFLGASTDTSRLRWNIVALDSYGTDRVLSTSSDAASQAAPYIAQFRNWAQGADGWLANINPMTGSNTYFGAAASLSQWGDNIGGVTNFSNAGTLGGSLDFVLVSERSSFGTTALTDVQSFNNQWTLDVNGDLTYAAAVAAIPEPSEYALMLAGLGMLGFMARRRLSNRV